MSVLCADEAVLTIGSDEDVLGGLTKRSLTLSRMTGDRTEIAGDGWQKLGSDERPVKAELRGEGVFVSGAATDTLRAAFSSGEPTSFGLVLPGEGTWSGRFIVRQLTLSGRAEGTMAFAVRLASSGPVQFTPV